MRNVVLLHKILILLFGVAISVHAVPPVLNYAGQVAVNGEAFDGNGLFKFALVNADGTTTYWSNDGTSERGSEPKASVSVAVNGGLYSLLLGNTALKGMGAIDPAVFVKHTDAKLRVWFSDGVNGFQQLSPDRPFASVPYAFNSESAKSADTANVATTAMTVLTGAITKQMLGQDVLSDLNRTVNHNDLSPQIKADINATIGMNRLSTEVTEKLNQEKTTTNYNAPSVGSLLAVPCGSDAPTGYSLYQQGEPKELVWEEKASTTTARGATDGVELLDGKIYFVGGGSNAVSERYNPLNDTWETIAQLSAQRVGIACAVLNGKLYAIGGKDLKSVEIYDPEKDEWESGISLPSEVWYGCAITFQDKIYLIGGNNSSGNQIKQVLCFDPIDNLWSSRANMPTARHGHKLVLFENRIWAIGGFNGNFLKTVESYDVESNSWQIEKSLSIPRNWSVAWTFRNVIFCLGGYGNGERQKSIEIYRTSTGTWSSFGLYPERSHNSDGVVLNDRIFIIAGTPSSNTSSDKVYAADLNASVEGVYDLYRKDGDAPVGTPVVQSEYADGSVTTAKLDATILKYLKPEITSQPQASTIYAGGDGVISFSVEGKYLTYQWKKDGLDLAGETNATLNITDANATLHDGNYSVVVSNDFGSVESGEILVDVNTTWSTDGLVGWWKFDEGSGTVAYDSSGNGNKGNLTNGPTWATGKTGGALSFDGVNDHINLGKNFGNFGRGAFSISLWMHSNSAGVLISKRGTSSYGNFWVFRSRGDLLYSIEFDAGNSSNHSMSGIGETPITGWKHIVFIRTGSLITLFQNGNEDGTANMVHTQNFTNSYPVLLGVRGAGSDGLLDYYKGLIDDVRIYDRALSAEEVQALYNLGQ